MYGDGVLVILTCYSRPQNMPAVIAAWRAQSSPAAKIVVVDNRSLIPFHRLTKQCYERMADPGEVIIDCDDPRRREWYPENVLLDADDVWRWAKNSGCPCHLAPALMLYGHRYVMFADDDFLPGRHALEYLLIMAKYCDDEFSTIGQVGRMFTTQKDTMYRGPGVKGPAVYTYFRGNAPRNYHHLNADTEMVRVDLTCRTSFVRADCVRHALTFRQKLLDKTVNCQLCRGSGQHEFHFAGCSCVDDCSSCKKVERLVGVHDDFLKCCGIQMETGWPSYVISRTDDPETELVKTEIPNGPESVYKRPGHYEDRQLFVDLAVVAGWKSLV